MPAIPSEDLDERVLKLVDELDAARMAYRAIVTSGSEREVVKHLSRIRELAAKIDLLRYGAGDEPKICTERSTEA